MAEKRNITKEDIFLKARIISEGVRFEVKKPPETGRAFRPMVMDGCEIVCLLRPSRYSRLEAAIDGEDVAISDMGEVLCTGTLEERRSWLDEPMSDGRPVGSVFSGSVSIINVVLNFRCYNYDSGKGCKYCGLFANPVSIAASPRVAHEITARQVETAVIAAQNGWRGTVSITYGTPKPSQRGEMLGRLERVMTQFRQSLDDDILSQLHMAPNMYPPDDFAEMYKWKDFGVNAAEFDLEVMDPAYFKAICPGKSEAYSHEHWKEAQEAAAEIFGRGRGSFQSLVTGIEPMSSLVEGVEERISKGVYSAPLSMVPMPGAPYEAFSLPSAEWFVEANEKMADSYFRYADTCDVNLLDDDRPGFTRVGLSYSHILVRDEMMRRLQETGKRPPGLPRQDG